MKSLSVFRVKQERVSTFIFHTNKVDKPLDAAEIAVAFLNHEYGGIPDREIAGG